MVHQTVMGDGKQCGNKHREFLDDPKAELKSALAAINNNTEYRQQYGRFLGPLVYAKEKPDFHQGLSTLNALSVRVLGSDILPDTMTSTE